MSDFRTKVDAEKIVILQEVVAAAEASNKKLLATIEESQAREARLVKALLGLMDVQNGPPLAFHKDEWDEAMKQANAALAPPPGDAEKDGEGSSR